MKKIFQKRRIRDNQSGIASILVTMIMMVVLTLIVLGYAAISRREQTNSLNTQLSSQAFYAAESGVNDAQTLITQQLQTGTSIAEKTSCGDSGSGVPAVYSGLNGSIDPAHQVSYSCLLINPAPPSLQYSDITSDSTVIPINNENPNQAINSLTLQWYPKTLDANNSTKSLSGCPSSATYQTLPSQSTWASSGCSFGLLRAELVPTTSSSGTADLKSADLLNNEMTVYLMPVSSGGQTTTAYAACPATPSSPCGAIIPVQCSSDGTVAGSYCKMTITGLNDPGYSLRVQSLYNESGLNLQPSNGVSLTGAQVLVDATGQAASVLRRIQVRFSLTASGLTQVPSEAIQAGGNICKQFEVSSGYFNDKSGCTTQQAPPVITVTPPPPADIIPPPTGNAGIADCNDQPVGVNCPQNPPQGAPRTFYNSWVENTSNNPAATIIGCTWNWGDGNTTSGSAATGTLDDAACEPGEWTGWCYAYHAATYSISLTVYLSNGAAATNYFSAEVPYTVTNYGLGAGCYYPS